VVLIQKSMVHDTERSMESKRTKPDICSRFNTALRLAFFFIKKRPNANTALAGDGAMLIHYDVGYIENTIKKQKNQNQRAAKRKKAARAVYTLEMHNRWET